MVEKEEENLPKENNIGKDVYYCYDAINMKRVFLVLLSFLCCVSVNAAQFKTNAKSVYLFDYDSGTEIFSKNADEMMPPSSMLKLMTLKLNFYKTLMDLMDYIYINQPHFQLITSHQQL